MARGIVRIAVQAVGEVAHFSQEIRAGLPGLSKEVSRGPE